MRDVLILVVDRAPSGGIRMASPQLPDWAAVARTPRQLTAAVVGALADPCRLPAALSVEELLDADTPSPVLRRAQRSAAKPEGKHHPIAAWAPITDENQRWTGDWRAPGGHIYRAGTRPAALAEARWRANGYGLPPRAE